MTKLTSVARLLSQCSQLLFSYVSTPWIGIINRHANSWPCSLEPCWIIICRDTPALSYTICIHERTQTCLLCLCRTSVSALRCSWLPSPTTSRSHTSRTLTTLRVTPTVGRRSRQCSTCLTYMQTLSITSSMSVSSATHSPPYTTLLCAAGLYIDSSFQGVTISQTAA